MDEDVKQILVCKRCGSHLSEPVWLYREVDGVRKKNKGWAIIPAPEGSDLPEMKVGEFWNGYRSPGHSALEFKIGYAHQDRTDLKYALRPDTLSENIKRNKHWKIECCGPFPGKNPNLSCKCGIPVGYEFGDCYTAKFILSDPKRTKWQTVKS